MIGHCPRPPASRTGEVSVCAHLQAHAEHPWGSGREPSDHTCSVSPGRLADSPAPCALPALGLSRLRGREGV